MPDTRVMELPDGRELAWLEAGRPRGLPVFAFHGTPGSRRQVSFDEKAITAAGVRMVAPDRPGYGLSSFHPARSLAGWAADVSTLADHLKLEAFAVVGVSGGGPHALACAAMLPGRVTAAGIVSGVGPMGDPDFDVGMVGFNRGLSFLARRSPLLLRPVFWFQDFSVRHWPEVAMRAATKQFPAADVAMLERADVRAAFFDDARRASATADQAATQDFVLFARDWGFRLQDVTVPCHLWHGDADRNVLIGHGRFLARRIPGAVLHECPGEGHLLYVNHLEEVLRTVTSAA
ncbi:MAG TPA: alpha/beta hydrolase [Acidimicrobiales bacterium]|jgi:pimeloyl-ACP methyl ester carboxylesterase|nr:alpha/beta hydrolase [Acidimicrobiales bacterium]